MNNKPLLLTTCVLLSIFSNIALSAMDIRGERTSFYERNKPQPIGLNYTYIDLNYAFSIIENDSSNDDEEFQTGAIEVSFSVTPQISASLQYSGNADIVNNNLIESSELLVGATYHYPVSNQSDIYASLKTINVEFEDTNISSASGYTVDIGYRQRINDNMEWGASALNRKIEDVSSTTARLSFSYGSDSETQYIAGIETTNTDNKKTALTFSIRLNY